MTVSTRLQFECAEGALQPTFEFASFGYPPSAALATEWPTEPGAARLDASGRAVMLHFAPGRWLVPAPANDVQALVAAAEAATVGAGVDVSGKWREFALVGRDAGRVVACSVDPAAVLDGRDVAAVVLFDCPCLIARLTGGYAIWVRSSFAKDFAASVGRLRG
jgi:heterotetrameric sarcosine oxidase gamma subunit